MKRLPVFLLVFSPIIIGAFFCYGTAAAATIYVNSSTGNDTTGNGTSGSPYKTFHKGYTMAASGDTLNLIGTFTWTDADETGDAATTGYTIGKNITIQGQGADTTIVQATISENTADRRVFTIPLANTVTINSLTVRYGKVGSSQDGGGVYVNGIATINYTDISYNRAPDGSGGGIDVRGSLTIQNSTIHHNVAHYMGGGLNRDYYSGSGGVPGASDLLDIINCTISYNQVTQTVAYLEGGGVFFRRGQGSITNSTIAYNTIVNGGGTSTHGVGTGDPGAIVRLKNNIIAANTLTNCWSGEIGHRTSGDGTYTDNGGNIIGKLGYYRGGFTAAVTTWVDQADSCASPDGTYVLQNGGSTSGQLNLNSTLALNSSLYGTMTHAITNAASVAVNNGTSGANGSVSVPTTDQRGLGRVSTTDIGAYEYGAFVSYTLTVANSGAGTGTVTATGISCGSDCTESYASGTSVTLSASADAGSTFAGWSGGTGSASSCSGTSDCTFNITADSGVTATFTAPEITVTENVAPTTDLTIPFGTVYIASTSDKTVTVTNDGSANLIMGTIASANPVAAPFSITTDNCSSQTITPASNCTLTVRFTPTASLTSNDTFDIPSNDVDESSVTITVSGTGTPVPVPDIDVTDSLTPSSDLQMLFPDTTSGVSSTVQTVTITNSGTATLTVGNIQLTGTDTSQFSLNENGGSNPCGSTAPSITASGYCTTTITFSPTSAGAKSVTLAITSNDSDEGTVNVIVSGTGLSSARNNPPSAFLLVYPANGQTGLGTTITFRWRPTTDPDGGPVTYDLYFCAGSDPAACAPINVASAASRTRSTYYAGLVYWQGFLFAGIILSTGIRGRRKIAALIAVLAISGMLFISCGGGSDDVSYTASGLNSGTQYSWMVTAKDSNGDETSSETRSYTTE